VHLTSFMIFDTVFIRATSFLALETGSHIVEQTALLQSRSQLNAEGHSLSLADVDTSVLGVDLEGNVFDVDAPLSSLAWEPKSISVILPCAEEREYALKTVQSVFNNTPADLLFEIVVVDDGSNPPLSETHLTHDVREKYKVKIVRHDATEGLIRAKKDGGDAASGDILVFFDCHVAPQPGWHRDFVQLIGENKRRLIVPQITGLDIDTWTQESGGGSASKCYISWDADFKWFDSEDPYAPGISGGLLGLSKYWWRETGGYDEGMFGWGGENIDQSLRMWLCGGEILAAKSQVAHMWRSDNKATKARYKIVGDVGKNRARAAFAWYGNFTEKLKDFSVFNREAASTGKDSLPWYGDLSNLYETQDRLKCRPMAWFLRRFKHIYEDSGMIPEKTFMMKHQESGKCLTFSGNAGAASCPDFFCHTPLADCDESNDRQYWHLGNKDPSNDGECCNGLRAWNSDHCLDGGEDHGTTPCDITGNAWWQKWVLNSEGKLARNGGDSCLAAHADDGNWKVELTKCDTASNWTRINDRVPLETRRYHEMIAASPELFKRLDDQMEAMRAM